MKVVIDIPELECDRLRRDAGWTNLEIYRKLIKDAIEIADNATNGDIIKTIFPNEYDGGRGKACTYYGSMRFDTDWWDAPFKEAIHET